MSPTTLKIRLFLNGQKFQERTAAAPKPCRKGDCRVIARHALADMARTISPDPAIRCCRMQATLRMLHFMTLPRPRLPLF
jgi:hypothetical protein